MSTLFSSPRPLPALACRSPQGNAPFIPVRAKRSNHRPSSSTTSARNGIIARSSSSSSSPPTTTTSSTSSSPRALDAPPPSSTRPGEAWAELVPSTRQFEALKSAFVTVVGKSEAGPVAVSSLLLGEGGGGGGAEAGSGGNVDTTTIKRKKTLLVVARSFGCPFCQDLAASLARPAVLGELESAGISLYLVSIGTPETGEEFSTLTGFPAERLLADPGTQVYDALGLERGAAAAFLSLKTPLAIAKRASSGEGRRALGAALAKWKPFLPPRAIEDAKYQGGALVFENETCLWARMDRATADHLPAEELVEVALRA